MRETIASILIGCALAAPVFSAAKTPARQAPKALQAQPWANEPDGFLGIKFGEPFPDQSTIPDCPKYLGSIDFQIVNSLPGLCFDGYGRKSYGSLWNIPALGFPYSVDVMIDDGKPVTFIINTNPKWFPELAKVLSQRYGKPMSDTTGSVQSGTGAQFDNRTLRWVGQRVTITADMRSGQVDTSKTYISDKAYWDARERANEKAASDGASKL